MRKNIFVFLVVFILSIGRSWGQGYPVVDITHILETIRNGYQIYQQIQTGIQQLEYQYQSTKAQLQALQQLDPSKIDSLRDAVSMVDKGISFLRNTENNLRNMRVKVGSNSYSLIDLYKAPGGVFDEMTDLWTREMSEAEKARTWAYYGLDPRNYAYTQTWKTRISEGAQKLASMSSQVDSIVETNIQVVDRLLSESQMSDSQIGQMQVTNLLLGGLRADLNLMSSSMIHFGNLFGDKLMSLSFMPNPIQVSGDFLEDSSSYKLNPIKGLE